MSAAPKTNPGAASRVRAYIVQAGGQGSRMEHYTWNKPKCLVPIDGRPLLYHLMEQAPDAQFIIIGDYMFETLKAYLDAFPPPARCDLVRSEGKGTCAGLGNALERLDDPAGAVGVVWCDLLFSGLPALTITAKPIIGLSQSFPCRWSVDETRGLVEELSFDRGVAGYFVFPNASFLRGVPKEGEFVAWLSKTIADFETVDLDQCTEVGSSAVAMRHWEQRGYARFFNDVAILPDRVIKKARVPALSHKIEDEADWYEEAEQRGFKHAPKLLSCKPLTLQRIDGQHPDEMNLKPKEKLGLLEKVFDVLEGLHDLGEIPAQGGDCKDTYLDKTFHRVAKILALVPGYDKPFFVINGRRCRNPFAPKADFAARIGTIRCDAFRFFHGDPTFSNMLVDKAGDIFLIDPRVTFGKTKFFGDPDYDWAKLYYSAIGDYDAFNRRRFRLVVWNNTVSLDIDSAGFSFAKALFQERLGAGRLRKVELLHALIWLSLAGWVDDDVDSMIGAFFNGLLRLEEWADG